MLPKNVGERWSQHIQDALATDEKVREGLTDDEALPFMDWGNHYAGVLAARFSTSGAPEPNEEQVNETAYSLTRLMTRLTWLVTYRNQKDAGWLTQTFQMVNKLSRDLLGDNAPVFSDQEVTAWIADHAKHTNGELLQNLMARLAPAAEAAPPSVPPVAPAAGPLSNAVFSSAPPPTPPSSETPPASPLSNAVFSSEPPAEPEPPPASTAPSASPLSNWMFRKGLPGRKKGPRLLGRGKAGVEDTASDTSEPSGDEHD